MESILYTDITLPHPEASSPTFLKQRDDLIDTLDEIIESMFRRLSLLTGQQTSDLRDEIDALDDIDLDGDEYYGDLRIKVPQRNNRGRKRNA